MGDVYQALADPTRRKILDELAERDDQTLFEICARLTVKHQFASSRQAVSQHLDVLEAAGLILTRREGRCKFHHLSTQPLEHLADRWLRRPDPPGDTKGRTPEVRNPQPDTTSSSGVSLSSSILRAAAGRRPA